MSVQSFPVWCKPYPDEPLIGVIHRAAARNGVPVHFVMKLAGLNTANYMTPYLPPSKTEELSRLAALLHLDPEWVKKPDWQIVDRYVRRLHDQRFRQTQLIYPRLKICSLCLAEAPHFRTFWNIDDYRCCHVHGVRLQHSCPACKRPLRWSQPDLLHCPCGANLLKTAGRKNAAELKVSAWIVAAFNRTPGLVPPAFADKGLGNQLLLAHFLAGHNWDRTYKNLKEEDLQIRLGKAFDALADWPNGFNAYLRTRAPRKWQEDANLQFFKLLKSPQMRFIERVPDALRELFQIP